MVKKSLKNQKGLCINQKAIATRLSMATLENPLTLLSLSENDSEEEAIDEAPLDGDDLEDEDDDGDEEAKDDGDEDGGEDSEEGDDEDEEYTG